MLNPLAPSVIRYAPPPQSLPPAPAVDAARSANVQSSVSEDCVALSSKEIDRLQGEVKQLQRFSDRMTALSLASTLGVGAIALLAGPAALVPAMLLGGVSAVSGLIGLSSEDEALRFQEEAQKLQYAASPEPSTNAPQVLTVL